MDNTKRKNTIETLAMLAALAAVALWFFYGIPVILVFIGGAGLYALYNFVREKLHKS